MCEKKFEQLEKQWADFSNLQKVVWSACLDAAARKARLYIGDLTPSEKKAVVDMVDKLRQLK